MCIELSILQLHQLWWVELEIVDVNLLGRTRHFRLVRLGPTGLHVVTVVLIDGIVAFAFPLGGLDPYQVLPLDDY